MGCVSKWEVLYPCNNAFSSIPEKKSISNAIFISTFSSRPQEIFHMFIDKNIPDEEFRWLLHKGGVYGFLGILIVDEG